MSKERRKTRRIPLDSLYFVEFAFEGDNCLTGLVIDISSGGLMIGLPPSAPEKNDPKIGEKGFVKDASPELAGVLDSNLQITVMWINEGLCGMAFEQPQPGIDTDFEAAGTN